MILSFAGNLIQYQKINVFTVISDKHFDIFDPIHTYWLHLLLFVLSLRYH